MIYTITKCRRILRHGCSLYEKKGHKLFTQDRLWLEDHLEKLDHALLAKNRKEAAQLAKQIDKFLKIHFPKTFVDHAKEFVFALGFAIVFAFLIRQFWFELYEVPTGSMRPSIEELDRLVVSKTSFGINPPFQNKLTFFKPEYLQRGGMIVFTVEDMDVEDSDTRYFYLFPGKKRFVKRLMGKPGDTLYFYGGKIYGVDASGCTFEEDLGKIDHIPFITLAGNVELASPLFSGMYAKSTFLQMHQPVASLDFREGKMEGLFLHNNEWKQENLNALKEKHVVPEAYSDLWGIKNYAVGRLLTPKDVKKLYGKVDDNATALLYLELHHTPNVSYPHPEMGLGDNGKTYPQMTSFVTLLPLTKAHLATLQQNLYTARFYIRGGRAYRYTEGQGRPQPLQFDPLFLNVPDGRYEFYYGKGSTVHWGGIQTELPKSHPLYSTNPENIQKLFNFGMNFNTLFQPYAINQPFLPQRFAYYREGDLYVMGAPLMKKDDPVLIKFTERELLKQKESNSQSPYIAFVDRGAPVDVEFIKAFGLKVPDDAVLALGDNHAMSGDSRVFGFVPIQNLRGAPSFTFWPPSNRLGRLPQPKYPWITLPNILIWSLVALIAVGVSIYLSKRNSKPRFKRKAL